MKNRCHRLEVKASALRSPAGLIALIVIMLAGTEVFGVERFPPPDFETAYRFPVMEQPAPRANWREWTDVAVLAVSLCAATWLVLWKRNRKGLIGLSLFCLAYFGFYRRGCICPVGAIQNVSLSLFDGGYAIPLTVALFFALPVVFSLLFGRVFCSAVCPLGAVQDIVLIRPARLPLWLAESLGTLPFVYLGVAVLFSATHSAFFICRYDPFVSIFRLSGNFDILVLTGFFLILSTFVGRPYCRFLCPYGALLGILSKVAWRKATITPDECIVCGLCEDACPVGAIRPPTPKGVMES